LTAFGLSCTPPLERQTRTALRLRPHPVDTLVPLARAPIAAFHRIGRRGSQRRIEQRQRFCQRGGKALLQRVTAGGAPRDTPPHLLHAGPQRLDLGEPTADAPQGLPFGVVQVTLDAQMA
jgi:hypothetical protein